MLGWGNTIGMTVAGIGLLSALGTESRAAVAGLARTLPVVIVAAAASAGTGYLLAEWLGSTGLWLAFLDAAVTSAWVVLVFAVVVRVGRPGRPEGAARSRRSCCG